MSQYAPNWRHQYLPHGSLVLACRFFAGVEHRSTAIVVDPSAAASGSRRNPLSGPPQPSTRGAIEPPWAPKTFPSLGPRRRWPPSPEHGRPIPAPLLPLTEDLRFRRIENPRGYLQRLRHIWIVLEGPPDVNCAVHIEIPYQIKKNHKNAN
jgi:hypothetical protein